jgi:hypothetical protein
MDALTFATGLLAQGIEILVRNNRLWVWPAKAFAHLTDTERAFIQQHRDELKDLAESKVLPETTVVWSAAVSDAPIGQPARQPTVAPAPCSYCGRACVGPDHHAYEVLHYDDPAEVARRDQEATKVMMRMVRFGNPY